MLRDDVSPGCPQARAKREREDDKVVHLTEARKEVRDEVDREREVAGEPEEEQLAPPGHALVPDEPPQEDDDVRDETRERDRRLPI